ncbi:MULTISPECIES: IS110 family transposase [Alphaproteobacteria]|jgi:transposase|uniref:IS110 family transposase ISMex9 n=2 Tax=Hyphomicrobiales TaxID=356 RepID=A0A5S9PGF1_9HYPH|nr:MULTISPECIES: IS110 family transposase [Alphaproteobacteria]MCA0276218.1 IS110 family transposase [Pseudomonadota bacterium]ODT73868.1 MAG: IS110 family transposase [Pelagibacterium sp. SCN 64-44]QOD64885.1 IS110 family transposase [Ochrobactrum sp. MT180101]RTL91033.1 IS110 family transposase [Ancylobacter aquaticus]KIZ32534.1 transposase [Rhodopseudomonas palustris]|tara:strand:- start:1070 stop:2116 length:1047 start_codon:yes stop_codon:yes gene_type:complete
MSQSYYIGLDVSARTINLCVVNADGQVAHERKLSSNPEEIAQHILSLPLPVVRVGLEAGMLSQHIYGHLAEAGIPIVCVETRHMKAALSAQLNKTDRHDARGIAQMMRVGLFKPVHVKTPTSQRLRTVLTARQLLRNKLQDVENEIRGLIRNFGYHLGKVTARDFEPRVRELIAGSDLHIVADTLLLARRSLREQFGRLDDLLVRLARDDTVSRRFMTVPGVGPLVALIFRATVDVPSRFTRSRTVGAHFGLTPRKHQSGEVDRTGRISRWGDAMTRSALYEAAQVLLTRVKRWSTLKAWAAQVSRRRGHKKAIVALARRIGVILHRMWVDGTEFDWGKRPEAAAPLT